MFRPFGWLILIGSLLTATVGVAAESAEVNLDYVAKRALERAKEPFHSPRADLPKGLVLGAFLARSLERLACRGFVRSGTIASCAQRVGQWGCDVARATGTT